MSDSRFLKGPGKLLPRFVRVLAYFRAPKSTYLCPDFAYLRRSERNLCPDFAYLRPIGQWFLPQHRDENFFKILNLLINKIPGHNIDLIHTRQHHVMLLLL
jgi:hypothetical protein